MLINFNVRPDLESNSRKNYFKILILKKNPQMAKKETKQKNILGIQGIKSH